MTYRLVCQQDPIALGIELPSGDWDFKKFEEHVESCQHCRCFADLIKRDLQETVNGFLTNSVWARGKALEMRCPSLRL